MRAVLMTAYGELPEVVDVPQPVPDANGVLLKVEATGLCRSDWHAWVGHEQVALPHVPGHEVAGTIAAVGDAVSHWQPGDRVTLPFVVACGTCEECLDGNHQVCRNQQQPGFSYWGSYAEYVLVPNAEVNLVRLPDEMSFTEAAGLGCRFATAYRAVRQVGSVTRAQSLVVFGCGGVGLSAVMIGAAAGANVIAVDVNPGALDLAAQYGAKTTLQMHQSISREIRSLTDGGAHVTIDAMGSVEILQAGLRSLRALGKHIQVGLLHGELGLKLGALCYSELSLVGSHGMAAHHYPQMLAEIVGGELRPGSLVTRTIGLDDAPAALAALSEGSPTGVTVICP